MKATLGCLCGLVRQKCPEESRACTSGEARKAKPVVQIKSPIAKDGCRNQTESPCEDQGILLQTQSITVSFISAAITEYHGLDSYKVSYGLESAAGKSRSVEPAPSEDLGAESHTACPRQEGTGEAGLACVPVYPVVNHSFR